MSYIICIKWAHLYLKGTFILSYSTKYFKSLEDDKKVRKPKWLFFLLTHVHLNPGFSPGLVNQAFSMRFCRSTKTVGDLLMEGTMLSHQLREKYNLPQNNIFKYFQMYQISSCILMGFPFKLWRRLFNLSLGFTKLRQFHQVTTCFSSNLSGKWIWERISWLMCGIRFGQVLQVAYLPTKPQSCSSWSNTGSKSH